MNACTSDQDLDYKILVLPPTTSHLYSEDDNINSEEELAIAMHNLQNKQTFVGDNYDKTIKPRYMTGYPSLYLF